jgi:hypothetical protein
MRKFSPNTSRRRSHWLRLTRKKKRVVLLLPVSKKDLPRDNKSPSRKVESHLLKCRSNPLCRRNKNLLNNNKSLLLRANLLKEESLLVERSDHEHFTSVRMKIILFSQTKQYLHHIFLSLSFHFHLCHLFSSPSITYL